MLSGVCVTTQKWWPIRQMLRAIVPIPVRDSSVILSGVLSSGYFLVEFTVVLHAGYVTLSGLIIKVPLSDTNANKIEAGPCLNVNAV